MEGFAKVDLYTMIREDSREGEVVKMNEKDRGLL